MSELETGTLKIKTKKNKKGNVNTSFEVSYINSKGQYRSLDFTTIPKEQIAIALQEKIDQVTGSVTITVEFETDSDRIFKIREQDKPWDRKEAEKKNTIPQRNRPQEEPKNVQRDHFHNPYNFVPAIPRNHLPEFNSDDPKRELNDAPPTGHGHYQKDYWSGRVAVKLTTFTPLLIPDAAEMTNDNGHNTYPVRLGKDGKPYLPPTSIKGMLRSAYEAVTNSRLGVLNKHDELLGYRMSANAGIQMVPARIENDHVCLYPGTSRISSNGKPQQGDPMYAAWLRRWDRNSIELDQHAINYSVTQQLPEHREQVRFWAQKFAKCNRKGNPIFTYWKVLQVTPYNQQLGQPPAPSPSQFNNPHQPTSNSICQFEGYVCITNKNITNKHDERIFFHDGNKVSIPLSESLRKRWERLIESYQNNQEFQNGLQCPSALGNTAVWSRHIAGGDQEKQLEEGTLCYAHVYKNGPSFEIIDLYPVMISRSLYHQTPTDILDPSLKPAIKYDQLSPADRIFGWVNQNGQGSYKGQLRVHSVSCLRENAIDNFGSEEASFPLAILGQPKPEQVRFYCADDSECRPLHSGKSNPKHKDKGEGYKYEDQNLRGRKVYPHHKGLLTDYWHNPLEDRTQQADNTSHYQEYRRPKNNDIEQREEQNRSIKGWVKRETEFHFDIDVINLSPVELGALLWLLSSPDIHYHRLGGGKPLGFGSVWLDVNWEQTDLRLGNEWAEFYRSLYPQVVKMGNGIDSIEAFKEAVVQAYGQGKQFEQVKFIAAFCRSSKGFDDNAPIHYPRVTPHPTAEGEAFEWFVRNEKESRQELGQKLSLPALDENQPAPLPIDPIAPNQQNQNRGRNRRR